jgi:hypothetical protein
MRFRIGGGALLGWHAVFKRIDDRPTIWAVNRGLMLIGIGRVLHMVRESSSFLKKRTKKLCL